MKKLKLKYEVALKIIFDRLGLDEITRNDLLELVEEFMELHSKEDK